MNPLQHLKNLLAIRQNDNLLRVLPSFNAFTADSVDFFSNDYLGFCKKNQCSDAIMQHFQFLQKKYAQNYPQNHTPTGATGSRLISGNVQEAINAENYIAQFHGAESSLIFSTGYSANVGLLGCLATENDVFLSDQLIHASMIDGIRLSNAKKLRFRHNDMTHLAQHLQNIQKNKAEIAETNPEKMGFTYILVESLYSMDGDVAPLTEIYALAEQYDAYIIVDEAHALAVYGENGKGFAHIYAQNPRTFARIYTFGKAFGTHGAVIVGSETLKSYLVNFARSFIYSTALSPAHYLHIWAVYSALEMDFYQIFLKEIQKLQKNITFFKQKAKQFLENAFFLEKKENLQKPLENTGNSQEKDFIFPQNLHILPSDTAIQTLVIGGNTQTKAVENLLRKKGFLVKAILSPTVPINTERLRLCLHSYNTFEEITALFEELENIFHKNGIKISPQKKP